MIALLVLLTACGAPEHTREKDIGEKIWERVIGLPDTVLVSKDHKHREFRMTYDTSLIDQEALGRMTGSWTVLHGDMFIHGSSLKRGRHVVVGDSTMAAMSGWGKLVYEYPFQVYVSEYGSNIYDCFVDGSRSIVLTEYNYRMDDLTIREMIEPQQVIIEVEWLGSDMMRLSYKNTWAELQRNND